MDLAPGATEGALTFSTPGGIRHLMIYPDGPKKRSVAGNIKYLEVFISLLVDNEIKDLITMKSNILLYNIETRTK